MKTNASEKQVTGNHPIERAERKMILKNKDSLRDLWVNIKHTNIHIVRVPEGEQKEKGIENLFEEIMSEKFPDLAKKRDI